MRKITWPAATAAALALAIALYAPLAAFASSLVQVSSDPYTNTTSQHKTQVEPDTFSYGSTIISAFQSGRFSDGGASNIGWAASTDGGATWSKGFLPGTTVYATPAGPFARASDPVVAYDAKHNVWLISSLPLVNALGGVTGAGPMVNRSTNGGATWSNPVVVTKQTGLDKDWIVCDNTASSPFYGNCYMEWDDNAAGNVIEMSTSSDGGLTWGPARLTAGTATGIGGQPLVAPNGGVFVPIADANDSTIEIFFSANGGASWSKVYRITPIASHTEAGNMRSGPLPSADIDAAGNVYTVWSDCRFEASCSANDIVMFVLGQKSRFMRIPIDAVGSGVDHFIPGIAVQPGTSGSTAHLALTYYYFPQSNCTVSTCQLDVGFVSSSDGGATWSTPVQVAGPMNVTWLANAGGFMVGDYISTSYVNGTPYSVFAVASKPGSAYNEGMFAPVGGLAAASGTVAANPAEPVLSKGSDHAASRAPIKVQ